MKTPTLPPPIHAEKSLFNQKGSNRPCLTPPLRERSSDDDLECGCCFTPFKLVSPLPLSPSFIPRTHPYVHQKEMVKSPKAHLFCKECLATHASTRIGLQDSEIRCLDTSGCAKLFAPYELYQVLPPKLLSQYERINQRKQVFAADLEGLEECPFCTWACVIDSEEEKAAQMWERGGVWRRQLS
jgi:TRIAD3 protein (E3 ubiquitin-protein ligase RNF216)